MTPARSASEDQAEIVAALASGRATGDAAPLKRIDTHMSNLFLAPDRVYKLKRKLTHPFTDYSTLEQRRLGCEAEMALNGALAPDLYLAAAPVIRLPGGEIRLGRPGPGTAGEIVDWVVVMRRFPDGALLDEIARAGQLTPALIIETAEVVACFHAGLAPHLETGHAVDYHRIIAGLARTETQGAAAAGLSPGSPRLFEALERALAHHGPLIEARRRAGWVRRGHGDLHLRNICLVDGRVTPFDALEFDPALATADVLHDIAFLLMDLRARGLPALANLAMNRYWDAARQPASALALLPLFMALRAAVRMAVAVEAGDLAEAQRYRRLGLELLTPAPARLVAIGGLSGTGKSTLAATLAPVLPGPCGARVLRTDVLRKPGAADPGGLRLADADYEPGARAVIYRQLAQAAAAALKAGAAVVADGTFREPQARAMIEAAARGHDFIGLWLRAELGQRIARVAGRRRDASDATPEIALAQAEPERLEPAWRVIAASGAPGSIAAEAQAML